MNQQLSLSTSSGESSCDWGRYRAYLRVLAKAGMVGRLQGKLDPSDIVQQTLLQAHRAYPEFHGNGDHDLMAWLKKILSNTLARTLRDFTRNRRDVRRERALEVDLQSSFLRVEHSLAANAAAPIDHLVRQEAVLKLCDAVERLPEAQRAVVELHHFAGYTITQVAEELHRSPAAVAGLLKRGLRTLRDTMKER